MEASPRILAACEADVLELARTMRQADADECRASCGMEPLAALQESVRASDFAHTLYLGGRVAAIYGCAQPRRPQTALGSPGVACVWALTSDAVEAHPRAFYAASRLAVGRMLERYLVLFNFVDARYTAALRWTARLGFQVGPPQPFGHEGRPFHPITLRRSYPYV